jgi:hypothetical protein
VGLPQTVDLPAIYEGTTWEGISSIEIDLPGGAPLNLTNAQLQMTFRRVGERAIRHTLSIGSGIVVTDAAEGLAQIPAQLLPLAAGRYYYETILTQSDGVVLALFIGVLEIAKVGVPT